MSRYVTETKATTAAVNQDHFPVILAALKERARDFNGYSWQEDFLKAPDLFAALLEFGIFLESAGEGYYKPVIDDVYVSAFAKDIIRIFAPYTIGEIHLTDGLYDIAIVYTNDGYLIKRKSK